MKHMCCYCGPGNLGLLLAVARHLVMRLLLEESDCHSLTVFLNRLHPIPVHPRLLRQMVAMFSNVFQRI